MVISHSLRKFDVFLKVPIIIKIRFCKNNVLGPIYINFMGRQRRKHGSPYISHLLFINNNNIMRGLISIYGTDNVLYCLLHSKNNIL